MRKVLRDGRGEVKPRGLRLQDAARVCRRLGRGDGHAQPPGAPRREQFLRRPDHQGNPYIRESRMSAPVRPRMQAAGLQCLKLQIAAASPDPQTHAFPGNAVFPENPVTQVSAAALQGRGWRKRVFCFFPRRRHYHCGSYLF